MRRPSERAGAPWETGSITIALRGETGPGDEAGQEGLGCQREAVWDTAESCARAPHPRMPAGGAHHAWHFRKQPRCPPTAEHRMRGFPLMNEGFTKGTRSHDNSKHQWDGLKKQTTTKPSF